MEAIKFRECKLEGGWLMMKPEQEDMGKAMAFVRERKADKTYTATLKMFQKKRSLDANQRMWALINEMSKVIHIPPEEIYQGYIPDVGDNYRVFPVKPEDINEFAHEWCHGHIGRMVEDMGACRLRDLRGYHNLKCYKGSSEYDVPTFSRLLDLVTEDCRNLGINVMSERERSLLLDEWEATKIEERKHSYC